MTCDKKKKNTWCEKNIVFPKEICGTDNNITMRVSFIMNKTYADQFSKTLRVSRTKVLRLRFFFWVFVKKKKIINRKMNVNRMLF